MNASGLDTILGALRGQGAPASGSAAHSRGEGEAFGVAFQAASERASSTPVDVSKSSGQRAQAAKAGHSAGNALPVQASDTLDPFESESVSIADQNDLDGLASLSDQLAAAGEESSIRQYVPVGSSAMADRTDLEQPSGQSIAQAVHQALLSDFGQVSAVITTTSANPPPLANMGTAQLVRSEPSITGPNAGVTAHNSSGPAQNLDAGFVNAPAASPEIDIPVKSALVTGQDKLISSAATMAAGNVFDEPGAAQTTGQALSRTAAFGSAASTGIQVTTAAASQAKQSTQTSNIVGADDPHVPSFKLEPALARVATGHSIGKMPEAARSTQSIAGGGTAQPSASGANAGRFGALGSASAGQSLDGEVMNVAVPSGSDTTVNRPNNGFVGSMDRQNPQAQFMTVAGSDVQTLAKTQPLNAASTNAEQSLPAMPAQASNVAAAALRGDAAQLAKQAEAAELASASRQTLDRLDPKPGGDALERFSNFVSDARASGAASTSAASNAVSGPTTAANPDALNVSASDSDAWASDGIVKDALNGGGRDLSAQLAKGAEAALEEGPVVERAARDIDLSSTAAPRGQDASFSVMAGQQASQARAIDSQQQLMTALPDLEAAPDTPEFPEEMFGRIRLMQAQGGHEARLNLHPAELGRLQISISTEGDLAKVAFTVDNPQAREALEQAMPRLREMLQQAGLQLADSSVAEQGQQGTGGFAASDSNEGPTGFAKAGSASDDDETLAPVDSSRATPDPDRAIDAYA